MTERIGDTIKISFVGDLMFLKEQLASVNEKHEVKYVSKEVFCKVKDLLKKSDYVVGNLETPVSDARFSEEDMNFNTPITFAEAVKDAGINFVTTANNHCLDRGVKGLEETIENLDKIGLKHTGTYLTKENSEEITVVDIKGIKFSILNFTYGTNSEVNGTLLAEDEKWRIDLLKKQNKPPKIKFNNKRSEMSSQYITDCVSLAAISNKENQQYLCNAIEKVKKAGKQADIVVVMPHIGGQYNPFPGTYTQHVIEQFRNAGATIIVAGHPHVPHHCEIKDGIFIAYSLGNFCTTPGGGYYIPNVMSEYGLILHTYWNVESKDLKKVTFSIVKNIIGEDGISRVIPVSELVNELVSPLEKERLMIDASAIAAKVALRLVDNPFKEEIDIYPPPCISN